MPKLTLVLGRRAIGAYDLDQDTIRVGREPGVDILIDNPSVSREHCEVRRTDKGWIVADLGSANGTYLNGKRIGSGHALVKGDEIQLGKFSILFEKEVEVDPATDAHVAPAAAGDQWGTIQIKATEVEKLLEEGAKTRKAHVDWESGGRRGTHQLGQGLSVLVGVDDLCDLQVPKGPKHHLLLINTAKGYEARNLALWGKMTVQGSATKRTLLKDGDVVEMGGVKVTFKDAI
jgi:hypothetical protein